MSFEVLVIPENPKKDRFILKPLVERMLLECGKPNSRVVVPERPHMNGYEDALKRLPEVVDEFTHVDLILFLVDADGKDRSATFQRLEAQNANLLCCAARQEIEVWLLAGHRDKLQLTWQQVRDEVHVKDTVFQPFVAVHGDVGRYTGGRDLLMAETLRNYQGLKQLCPELDELENKIKSWLRQSAE